MAETDSRNEQKKPVIQIIVNEKWCKRCGICIAFCPKEVFTEDETGLPIVKRGDRCIKCVLCEVRCPDFAVEVKESPEQTVRNSKFQSGTKKGS